MSDPAPAARRDRTNVRRPDVMELVSAEVARHYESSLVEQLRTRGGRLDLGNTTVLLAKEFGFCYGVERAIDLAYAARRVFPQQRIFLIGEIIHNPDVNGQLRAMEIVSLPWRELDASYDGLSEEDVVIVPAFGAPTAFMDKLSELGCHVVDTTCGDVMKVWRRVREYARDGVTAVIHGKSTHEETLATASRALGKDGAGHFLVVLTLADVAVLADYINGRGGSREELLAHFKGGYSPGFDPDLHLGKLGVANQTTMLKSETEEIQRRLRAALVTRDGDDRNFSMFDTICGATQERQDALFELLAEPLDVLLVVGGYNSSNTAHLVEIGEGRTATFFIQDASRLRSLEEIVHFDLHRGEEVTTGYSQLLLGGGPVRVGVTAGASCPNNLIEETIFRLFELRGIGREAVTAACRNGEGTA
ncbi:MAG: 4-hydroxy-3-methylbut-2-enyl diphosphate reductase [Akkermansiaceae bacterium]|nr:4-hydroxy-3-methylbut-2-enyl diphosphate reductase [Akkermansiaceae bacterium]